MPMISGNFDFFFACGGGIGMLGVFCGDGALRCCGNGALLGCGVALGGCGNGALGTGGTGWSTMVCEPVGPVFFGSTTVGADEEVAIVAPKSGCVTPEGLSAPDCGAGGVAAGGGELGGVRGAEARNVALGSKAGSATNKPPSMVQNF